MAKIAMLGTGLIGQFYTQALLASRSRDEVVVACSATEKNVKTFAEKWGIKHWTTDFKEAIRHPEVDLVVIGLPNHLHLDAVREAAQAGKAIMCTKPLGRNAEEARLMLEAVEKAGVFAGYLEDLAYTPKTLKALEAVRNGALGRILWTRSRETHPGPHSDWFWKKEFSGGGAIVDMGCHCIEIGRNFIGKDIRPVEAICWADTQVHPIEAEDTAVGLVRYENGALSQFEVSWTFRGGMDLRDEISGTEGTIWLNHWLRTGFEVFTSVGLGGYVAEKAEADTGWLFPVGDEPGALGYTAMFLDQLSAFDAGKEPMETFYDGYVVNAIIDACYRSAQSKKWEPVQLDVWRGKTGVSADQHVQDYNEQYQLIKTEKMPDGKTKLILKDKQTGEIVQQVQE